VSTVAAARGAVRTHEWSALFIEALMRDGSGWEILGLARRQDPSVPALVLLDRPREEDVDRAFDERATCLAKPLALRRAQTFMSRLVEPHRGAQIVVDTGAIERWELTPAEEKLFRVPLSGGTSQKYLASVLGISIETVRSHIRAILQKANAPFLRDAVHEALRGQTTWRPHS